MTAVRGYAAWNPKPETLALIDAVRSVLDEYEAYLPISLRQIFYRLVAEHGFEKTEAAYNRLGNHVARARRAQMLPFGSISDDQGRPHRAQMFEGVDGFWGAVRDDLDHYMRDRMAGQPVRVEVWCEAAWQQLFRVAADYSIPVYSSRGFASVTNSHAVAKRAAASEVPTVLLHVGDYDPSGESIFKSLTQDARSFLIQERAWREPDFAENGRLPFAKMDEGGPTIRPVRVALTWEQVEEYGIETAPAKPSDSRSKTWVGETAQAEALPPDLLSTLIREAIEAELDLKRYDEEVAAEEADRREINAVLRKAQT